MNNNISALILTYNEEKNIGKTLETLSFADEIVILDSISTDKTTEIAEKYNVEKIIKSEDLNAWAVEFGGYLSFDTKSKQILLELSATNKDIMNLMRIPRKPDWQDEEAKSFKAVSFNPEEIEKQKEIASVVEEAVKDAPQTIVDIEKQGKDVLDKKA